MINNDILGTKNIELKIYFMKLRADYFRYWSSVASDDKFFSKSSIKFHFFFHHMFVVAQWMKSIGLYETKILL